MKKFEKLDVRERALEHGMSFPFDEELIMLILGSGTKNMPVNKMALKILDTLNASNDDEVVENLLALEGVGQGRALAIAAALELGRRRNSHIKASVKRPEDIIPFVRNYAVSMKEHFLAVTLNGCHEIINIHVISVGTLNRSIVHPREVFSVAIKENAAAMILCHNHPSGNLEPSPADMETTKTLVAASLIMGIEILDHIIVDCESYFSFREHKILYDSSMEDESDIESEV